MTLTDPSAMPSLEEFVALLAELAELPDLDVHTALVDLGIASLDFLQWLFELDDRLGIDSGELIDMETVGQLDLATLHATLAEAVGATMSPER